MWEEASRITILDVEVYGFGFSTAIGMAAALLALAFFSWAGRCEKGTAPLLGFSSLLLGVLLSRITFCLLNQELGMLMPLSSWLQVSGGGWSMFGALGGAFLAAWLTGVLTGQKTGAMLDLLACAFPLFVAGERLGERFAEDFDISRALRSEWLKDTFLTVSDSYDSYLATYFVAAAAAFVLFVILTVDLIRSKRHGDTCLLFMMLFGAGATVLESLRYDRFLSISFVGLQQILAMLLLCAGVLIAALRKTRYKRHGPVVAAIVSLPLTAAVGVGLEFALDRTTVSPLLIYAIFVAVMAVPVILGLQLRKDS